MGNDRGFKLKEDDCLIVVDLQNDFCPPNGALAVPGGDRIVIPINRMMEHFPWVVTTQDWHPVNHCSFKTQGGSWPPHCVQGTWGADFYSRFKSDGAHIKIKKGERIDQDAYSGFQGTGLEKELRKRGVKRVFIVGLATDYCVKQTALDSLKRGFETIVLCDLVRAVNIAPQDGSHALSEVKKMGGQLTSSAQIALKENPGV